MGWQAVLCAGPRGWDLDRPAVDIQFAPLDSVEAFLLRNPEATWDALPSSLRRIVAPTSNIAGMSGGVDSAAAHCEVLAAGVVGIGGWLLGVGWLPIHRWILGGFPPEYTLLYVATCGGCYVLSLVDGVILTIAAAEGKDPDRYCNCDEFFLWKCGR